MKMPLDVAFWVYMAINMVSAFGFVLFEWWRKKALHASEVYLYVELLMLANLIYYSMNAYARWAFIMDPGVIVDSEYEKVISTCVWGLRAVPVLILISLIVGRMTLRAFGPWKIVRVINDNGKDKT